MNQLSSQKTLLDSSKEALSIPSETPALKTKIAFIRIGSFSSINDSVANELQNRFPDLDLEIIDIENIVKNRKDIVCLNSLFMIKEYGIDVILNRRNKWNSFFTTTYMFNKVKKLLLGQVDKNKYLFSFQTQSIFDTSTAGLPHFVYTDHTYLANGYYRTHDRSHLYSKSLIDLEKTIYHNATLNFTMSTHISRCLIEEYGCQPDRVVCVYAGSNSEISNYRKWKDKYGNKNILFVGMDWERKGGPELVAAFKEVLSVQPDARLTIVGCSPRVNLPNCEVVGRVPLKEMPRYYENASVFCLPTKLEPFGIVFVEALHHKLPVVGTNIGAIGDFIVGGVNGYLVKPGNVEELAKALITLVGDPKKCERFGERGSRIAAERYTWERVGVSIRQNVVSALRLQQYNERKGFS